jgi:hypothetical protein
MVRHGVANAKQRRKFGQPDSIDAKFSSISS